jgi:hypothetical protein
VDKVADHDWDVDERRRIIDERRAVVTGLEPARRAAAVPCEIVSVVTLFARRREEDAVATRGHAFTDGARRRPAARFVPARGRTTVVRAYATVIALLGTFAGSITAHATAAHLARRTNPAVLEAAILVTAVRRLHVFVVTTFASEHDAVATDGSARGAGARAGEPRLELASLATAVAASRSSRCFVVAVVASLRPGYDGIAAADGRDTRAARRRTGMVRLDLATFGGAAISRLRVAVVAYLAVAIDEPIAAVSGSVAACARVTRPAAVGSPSSDVDGAGSTPTRSASAGAGTAPPVAIAIDTAARTSGRTGGEGEEQYAHAG